MSDTTGRNKGKTGGIKKYLKYMGNAVSALSILFVLLALVRTDFDVSAVTDWRAFLFICLSGVALKTLTVFLSGSAWYHWLEFFSGKKCDRREALNVYAKANTGKYMPGNVMHYVERNLFARNLQLSQKQIAAASLSEVLCLVLTALLPGVLLAFSQPGETLQSIFADRAVSGHVMVLLCISAAAAGICIAALLLRYREKIFELARGTGWGRKLAGTFLYCFLAYAAVLLILGFILVLVYGYWKEWPSYQEAALMVSAYMIAWALGFIIPGAPGGIGVRELVLTLLLSPVVGEDIIVALGVLHRLITVLGDFAAYIVRKWL